MTVARNLALVAAWVLISLAFGVVDEHGTRLSLRWVAEVANSRLLWASWPLVVGFGIGGPRRGAVAGAVGTPAALLGFELVHGASLDNAVNAAAALLGLAVAVGALGGALGGVLRIRAKRIATRVP